MYDSGKRHKVNDTRSVKLEHVNSPDYIPFLCGRPKRTNPINKDDVTNLVIALETGRGWGEC